MMKSSESFPDTGEPPRATAGPARTRRQFLTTATATAAGVSAGLSATGQPAPKPGKKTTAGDAPPPPRRIGVTAAAYAIRARATRAGELPRSAEPLGDPLEFLEHSHRLGAGGIQVGVKGWEQGGLARKLRGRAEALGLYLEGQIQLPRSGADIDRFAAQARAARDAGATVLRTVALSGRRYERFPTAGAFATFRHHAWEALTRAEPVMRKLKLKLAVENHKDWRVDELLAILEKLSSESVGVTLDTGNNIALLEDPAAVAEALAPFAYSTHLKDMAVEEYPDGFLLSEVPLGEGFLDLKTIVETCLKANPEVQFNLEMITRDPLRIPCLTEGYWATFATLPGRHLAAALRRVRQNPPRAPLPRVSGKSTAEQVNFEEENNRRSVKYARAELGI